MPSSVRLFCAVALGAFLPSAVSAKQLCEREVVPFAAMVAAIKADPGTAVVRETAAFTEISDEKRMTIWTLVKPSGDLPAAYVCRKVVQEDGQVKINLTAECVGQTPDCDGVIGRILSEQHRATAPLRQR